MEMISMLSPLLSYVVLLCFDWTIFQLCRTNFHKKLILLEKIT
uniref:Uncharacterized protein n=1 Tax=Rhizophora mucronata TaxID=61149 RepID=A0A2P2N164_RHIMU